MVNKERKSALSEARSIFKVSKEFIIGVASLLTSLSGVILLLRQNSGSLFLISLIVCVILWLLAMFVYFRVRHISKLNLIPGAGKRVLHTKERVYPRRERRLAFIAIVVIPVCLVISFIVREYQFTAKYAKKFVILVADFENDDSQRYDATRIIFDQLYRATQPYGEVICQRIRKPIEADSDKEGSEIARRIGIEKNAMIVLWGRCVVNEEKARIIVHFEVLDNLPDLPLRKNTELVTTAISELRNFTIQEELSKKMSYLTLLTVGLIRAKALDLDGAIARFSDALNNTPVPKEMVNPALIYLYRGCVYMFKFDFDNALSDFSEVIKLQPDNVMAHINRAALYLDKEQYDLAFKDVNEAIRLDNSSAEAYLNRGIIYDQWSEYEKAIQDYSQALKLKPDTAAIFNNLGVTYLHKAQFDIAIDWFNKAVGVNPKIFQAYYGRGCVYMGTKDYDRAIAEFNYSIRLNPKAAESYFKRGEAYTKKRFLRAAVADYERAIQLEPNEPRFQMPLAEVLASIGNSASATAIYDRVSTMKLNTAEDYLSRGLIFANKGDKKQAIADYDGALKLNPNYVLAYLALAQEYRELKNFDLCIMNLNRANQIEPSFIAYFLMGSTYEEIADYKNAISNYSLALTWRPSATKDYKILAESLKLDDSKIYCARANAYLHNLVFDKAIADCNSALQLDQKYKEAYSLRASAYSRKGKFGEAIADHNKLIELTPKQPDNYVNRAVDYSNNGDIDLAIADCTYAIQLQPDHIIAYLNRVAYYVKKRAFDKALADANYAVSLKPDYDLAYNHRAALYIELKAKDKAIPDLKRLIELTKNPLLRRVAERQLKKWRVN